MGSPVTQFEVKPPAKDEFEVKPPTEATPDPEGFFESFAKGIGGEDKPTTMGSSLKNAAKMAIGGPLIPAAQGIYEGAKRSGSELMQAGKDAFSGNGAGAAYHGVKAIPIVGPALDKMADQAADNGMGKAGNTYGQDLKAAATSPGAMGTGAGTAAQLGVMALSGADAMAPERPLIGQIPTKSRAGALLGSLDKDLANTPVNLKNSAQPLQRAAELSVGPGASPAPFNAFLSRSQGLEPMTFPEARDYQSGMSNPSVMDRLSTSGKMRGAVKQLNKNFFTDIQDAAETAGRGDEFAKGMKDYKNAARLSNAAKMAGVGAAASIAGPKLLRYLRPLVAE